MKNKSLLLAGIIVALIICANTLQQAFRSYTDRNDHTEIRKRPHKPFPANSLHRLKSNQQFNHFI
jgi:hypothetical protein